VSSSTTDEVLLWVRGCPKLLAVGDVLEGIGQCSAVSISSMMDAVSAGVLVFLVSSAIDGRVDLIGEDSTSLFPSPIEAVIAGVPSDWSPLAVEEMDGTIGIVWIILLSIMIEEIISVVPDVLPSFVPNDPAAVTSGVVGSRVASEVEGAVGNVPIRLVPSAVGDDGEVIGVISSFAFSLRFEASLVSVSGSWISSAIENGVGFSNVMLSSAIVGRAEVIIGIPGVVWLSVAA
jgi:hypothetical protein